MDTTLSSLAGIAGIAGTVDSGSAGSAVSTQAEKQPINLRTSPAAQLVQALPRPTPLAVSGSVGTQLNELA
ncbi:MAG: putative motility protein [Caldimonas sp.]